MAAFSVSLPFVGEFVLRGARIILRPHGRLLPPVQRWYAAGGSIHEEGPVVLGAPFRFAEVAPVPDGADLPADI